MIKNLLYSLFIHFLLLLVVYANLNFEDIEAGKPNEIAVSLVSLDGDENSANTNPNKNIISKPEEKPNQVRAAVPKKPKSHKKSLRNKVEKSSKKLAKSKPTKSIEKPEEETVIQEYRSPEELDEKQKDSDKSISEDKKPNENEDQEQNEAIHEEEDLGSKENVEEEEESLEEEDLNDANAIEDITNNIENIDLSTREKINVQSQLNRCYKQAMEESKLKSTTKLFIRIHINEDGRIDSDALDDEIDFDRYDNPQESSYQIAVDNVRRAIDLCSPLRNLPLDKYSIWKEAMLEFGSEEIIEK